MIILRIEHKIAHCDGWKKAFDSDPIGRKKMGVKKYRIYQPVNDSQFVIIDLEFEQLEQAQAALVALQGMWKGVDGTLILNPHTQLLVIRENKQV
ncbi:hypothetical protein IC229_18695 [Spirosoma sp. BT702]|uniref:Uncharacterized protein n=1 Tax=Spirosoma profusum TaxID=2771354 RepID=A0A926XXS0_9BACT|nr:hypothetical protein [Spirosoma profusum]MBD2702682.1 hypothetical protein [Spirosoma profusum]